ncbi:hypothetical protein ABI244_20835 [Serratia ureilytica]|uniref:DUF5862 family protein n=1 Tax=Serratia ureilytica TaxID=300181 RepID=UPI003267D3F2
MKELNAVEINAVSGGDFEGLVWGVLDGLATGVTVGGSASRSAVFGPAAQGVGAILGGVIGPVVEGSIGLLWGKDAAAGYAQDFRENFGTGHDVTLN